MYDSTFGRFLQRDPVGYAGGLNSYEYTGGNPTGNLDPLGTCTVCSSGVRYRVAIGSLDAHTMGTPYANRAAYLADRIEDKDYNLPAPKFKSAGPLTIPNEAFTKGNIQYPAGTFVGGYFLFFVDWDICQKDSPCELRWSEESTTREAQGEKMRGIMHSTIPFKRLQDNGHTWETAKLKPPVGGCDEVLVYASAPGAVAGTQNIGTAIAAGFYKSSKQTLQILDQKTQKVVDTVTVRVSVEVNAKGVLTEATP
jgi:hypothetical protein